MRVKRYFAPFAPSAKFLSTIAVSEHSVVAGSAVREVVKMRFFGLKPVPVAVSAVAIYAVGFLIYGVVFANQWMALAGYTEASFAGQEWRIALSPIMPILITLGVGFLVKDRGICTAMAGIKLGAMVGLFFLVATRLYTLAYGTEPVALFALDSAHLMLNAVLAGGILGAMKAAD
jgi:hypothetical protein